MAASLLRRLAASLVTAWAAATLVFLAIHVLPGDPAVAALQQSTATERVLEQRRAALGLDRPLAVQYLEYWESLARGDTGVSWATGQPVSVMLAHQLPATVSLAGGGLIVATIIGLFLGITSAAASRGAEKLAARLMAGLLLAVPVTVTGTLVILVFGVILGGSSDGGNHATTGLLLPSLVVGLSTAGSIARAADAGLSQALHEPFFRAALARGLPRSRAVRRHGLRIGLLPLLDLLALQFGYLLSGAVVTEVLFARQGVGRLLLAAVLARDLPVVAAIVLLAALAYSLLNLLADTLRVLLDPRLLSAP